MVNELQVVPNAQQKAVASKDSDVKDHVQQSIASHENLKDVNVNVKGGVVRLTGTVPTEEDRLKAAVEARKAAGVRAVHDELRIRAGESRRTSG